MKITILYPSSYFDAEEVEPDFRQEYEAARRQPEFETALFGYDGFLQTGELALYPHNVEEGCCVYRGWMLAPDRYAALYRLLMERGLRLINAPEHYEACHLFPNAYPDLEGYTPKALWFPFGDSIDLEQINRTFGRFMLKDYVKSVKGSEFPKCFSTPITIEELQLDRFLELRGSLFTGGFLFKEYVDLRCYDGMTNEYRAFFLEGELVSLSRNSQQPLWCPEPDQSYVRQFSHLPSWFYTVDFAELDNGEWIVVETGDGQVSGLSPGQDAEQFYRMLALLMTTR